MCFEVSCSLILFLFEINVRFFNFGFRKYEYYIYNIISGEFLLIILVEYSKYRI